MISLNQALNKSQGRFNVKYINASSLMQQVCTLQLNECLHLEVTRHSISVAIFAYHFRTPGGNRKGLIKQGLSVLSSVLLSRRFLRIVLLFFSEFWRVARNPYEVVRDRNGFSGKKFFAQKFGKMDQKWAKNRVLNLLKDLVINFY